MDIKKIGKMEFPERAISTNNAAGANPDSINSITIQNLTINIAGDVNHFSEARKNTRNDNSTGHKDIKGGSHSFIKQVIISLIRFLLKKFISTTAQI